MSVDRAHFACGSVKRSRDLKDDNWLQLSIVMQLFIIYKVVIICFDVYSHV